jgi:hypothetical protein
LGQPKTHGVSVKIETYEKLKAEATKHGVSITSLLEQILSERKPAPTSETKTKTKTPETKTKTKKGNGRKDHRETQF